jgi:hypothetical protein
MTTRQPTFSLLVALALAAGLLAGLSGCGSPEKPAPPLRVDACHLFTFDDAIAIAGDRSIGGTLSSTYDDAKGASDPLQCVYTDGATEAPRVLGLLVRPFASREEAEQIFEATRARLGSLAGVEPVEVKGVGDRAVWGGGHLGQLHLLRGNVELVITSQGGEGSVPLDTAKGIAGKVLPRLAAAQRAAAAKPAAKAS